MEQVRDPRDKFFWQHRHCRAELMLTCIEDVEPAGYKYVFAKSGQLNSALQFSKERRFDLH